MLLVKSQAASKYLQSFGLIILYEILSLGRKHWFCKKGDIKYLACSKSLSLQGGNIALVQGQ